MDINLNLVRVDRAHIRLLGPTYISKNQQVDTFARHVGTNLKVPQVAAVPIQTRRSTYTLAHIQGAICANIVGINRQVHLEDLARKVRLANTSTYKSRVREIVPCLPLTIRIKNATLLGVPHKC